MFAVIPVFVAKVAVLLFGAVSLACSSMAAEKQKEDLRYDASRPLLSLHTDLRKHAESELPAVLEALFSTDAGAVAKPLVVYVHGRGHEPKKSFSDSIFGRENRVIEKIEQQGVLVLGIDWDSASAFFHPRCSRPFDKAIAAGPLLVRVVAALASHRETHAAMWRQRKVVLLVHSMGGFVLREAMQTQGADQVIGSLFDIKVISESDVPLADHGKWVPARPTGTTFVLSNPNDSTLLQSIDCDKSGAPETGPRLGTLAVSNLRAAVPAVTYIQLAAGKRHRIFTKLGANGNPYVCSVVHDLLNGRTPALPDEWRDPANANAYAVPPKSAPNDACIAGAIDDIDDDD